MILATSSSSLRLVFTSDGVVRLILSENQTGSNKPIDSWACDWLVPPLLPTPTTFFFIRS